ncbi:MAG: multidrug resistance transporter, superfamily protein [Frankiales bacterium]|nr:multidrug resistance transporter, superfamily protein [Frankiales bacterium]
MTQLSSRHGRLVLLLLCAVAFLDFVDASIVNVALPAMRADLHFSVQELQWVPSGYLLTYGGLMLLGGRVADLLGRRRVLVAGTVVIAVSSLLGGLVQDAGLLVVARLAQGVGAALMLPAALSILTTSFRKPADRHAALGVWGAVGGLASAIGVLLGGILTEGPGWRWVLFVNPIAAALVIPAAYALLPDDRRRARLSEVDVPGSILVTGGMLVLVFSLVRAPEHGWGSFETVLGLAGAATLLGAFWVNERRVRTPLIPPGFLRIPGVAAASVTGLTAFAGLLAMFFFLTLYMQNVLHYSPLETGLAYLPLTVGVGVSAGISSRLMAKVGTRPLVVVGAVIGSAGLFVLSRIPADGSYAADLLPGLLVVSLGLGAVFVAVTTAANAGVAAKDAGLAAALLNASQQVGSALGLAIFSAAATARTTGRLQQHEPLGSAATAGFQRALLLGCVFLLAAAVVGLRVSQAHSEEPLDVDTRDEAMAVA